MRIANTTSERVTGLEYVIILVLILNSSHIFLQGFQDAMLGVSAVAMLLLAWYRKARFTPSFLLVCAWLLVWIAWVGLIHDVWNVKTVAGFYCRVILGFCAAAILGIRLFVAFEALVYRLTLISLPLFLLGLLVPQVFELIHRLLSVAPAIFQVDAGWWNRTSKDSLMVYTFWLDRMHQNHGFMWEPTAFASVLLPALVIRMAVNRFKIDRHVTVLLLGLMSTFSTTGFIAGMLYLPLYWWSNSKRNGKVLILVVASILLPVIAMQDFVADKVVAEFERGDQALPRVGGSAGTAYGNSRLSSFIWDMRDFVHNPILGIGYFSENRYSGENPGNSVNDVSDTLVRFGLINTIMFLVMYCVSFIKFSRAYSARGWPVIILMLLTLCWSEGLVLLPLFLAFQFYSMTRKNAVPGVGQPGASFRWIHA